MLIIHQTGGKYPPLLHTLNYINIIVVSILILSSCADVVSNKNSSYVITQLAYYIIK